jgi:8-oxo-dGTP pyrophosphatase MutT (NUDIX family)
VTVEQLGGETIAYQGRIVDVVTRPVRADDAVLEFEYARRPPGVRLVLYSPDRQAYLCTSEFRLERGGSDLRLAGGKVFDTSAQYVAAGGDRDPGALEDAVLAAARREAREELGIRLVEPRVHAVSPCGATVIWDLFYVTTSGWEDDAAGPQLEPGESSIQPHWLARQDVLDAVVSGRIGEERSAVVLLRHAAAVAAGLEEVRRAG